MGCHWCTGKMCFHYFHLLSHFVISWITFTFFEAVVEFVLITTVSHRSRQHLEIRRFSPPSSRHGLQPKFLGTLGWGLSSWRSTISSCATKLDICLLLQFMCHSVIIIVMSPMSSFWGRWVGGEGGWCFFLAWFDPGSWCCTVILFFAQVFAMPEMKWKATALPFQALHGGLIYGASRQRLRVRVVGWEGYIVQGLDLECCCRVYFELGFIDQRVVKFLRLDAEDWNFLVWMTDRFSCLQG